MIVSWAFCREKKVTSLEQRIYQKEQERQQLLLFYQGRAQSLAGLEIGKAGNSAVRRWFCRSPQQHRSDIPSDHC